MPEQITKYPDVTLRVLKGAGARCGEGAEQKILGKCPADRFCSLPTGEMCVYGIEEIPQMTQITAQELARVVCPSAQPSSLNPGLPPTIDMMFLGGVFAAGLVVGRFWPRPRSRPVRVSGSGRSARGSPASPSPCG